VTSRNRRSFSSIVKSLIYQLAKQHPSGLLSLRERTYEALTSPHWNDNDPSVAYPHMIDTLSNLLAHIDDGKPVVIIIDRLDQCCWSSEPGSEENPLYDAVSSLLYMLRSESLRHINVKILLVMDERPARLIPETFVWASWEKLLECRLNWDQQIDDD
jgi:hypothetical protein